jgi:hypothetical protein
MAQMRKGKLLMAMLVMLMFWVDSVFAEEDVTFELTADYFGKYIWRGQNLDDDNVFQPGVNASYKGLTLGIWGNMELTKIHNNRDEFTEFDYSLDYSADVPGLSGVGFSVGLIYYDFPNTNVPDTVEAYCGFGFDLPLSPSVTWYLDLDEAEGSYVSLGLEYSIENIFELGPDIPVAMQTSASLGWGSASYDKYYWGTDQSKLNDLAFSASFPFEVACWTIKPSANYVTLVSDDIRDTDVYGTSSDFFFAGIGASKSF